MHRTFINLIINLVEIIKYFHLLQRLLINNDAYMLYEPKEDGVSKDGGFLRDDTKIGDSYLSTSR